MAADIKRFAFERCGIREAVPCVMVEYATENRDAKPPTSRSNVFPVAIDWSTTEVTSL